MCIRDRAAGVAVLTQKRRAEAVYRAYLRLLAQRALAAQPFIGGIRGKRVRYLVHNAVSYTHLDVYKRQCMSFASV